MKKLIAILLAGCTFFIGHCFQEVAAADDGTPLHKLAGTYSATVQGTVFVCLKNGAPFPAAQCGADGSAGILVSILHIGATTFDAMGNSCKTLTGTYRSFPVDAAPTTSSVFYSVSKITSYDPATGTGEQSFTTYAGGHCNGASFDSTGATAGDAGTERIAVSNSGKRIDTVVTSDIDTPVNELGGVSVSVTLLRQ